MCNTPSGNEPVWVIERLNSHNSSDLEKQTASFGKSLKRNNNVTGESEFFNTDYFFAETMLFRMKTKKKLNP